MPAVDHPALILLTGGTGFVGSAILQNLLVKGFSVRAAIRSESKASLVKSSFQTYIDSAKLTFVIVTDLLNEGAFDDAVKDVDAIVHCASPSPPANSEANPKDIIDPAVKRTVGILESAARYGSKVKRVVVTSSVVTLFQPHQGLYVYSEVDWFDRAPELVAEQGAKATGGLKYIASKVLAERAAWSWIEKNKPAFDLVTILPPLVWGQSPANDIFHFRDQTSTGYLLSAVTRAAAGGFGENEWLETCNFVDIRDIAEGHVKALVTPAASGERFILRGGAVTWQDVFDILNGNPIDGVAAAKGEPGKGRDTLSTTLLCADKAGKILGVVYHPVKDTIHNAVAHAAKLGWKQEGRGINKALTRTPDILI